MQGVYEHRSAVWSFCERLKTLGIKGKIQPENNSPFDVLLSNGLKVEIKVAQTRTQKTTIPGVDPERPWKEYKYSAWCFNIHRHGKLSKAAIDFYAFYLVDQQLWLIIPSQLIDGKLTVRISARALQTWAKPFKENFDLLNGRKP